MRAASLSTVAWLLLAALPLPPALAADEPPAEPGSANSKAPSQEELDRWFAETLSGATLVGSFTIDGQEGQPPAADRYPIAQVKKLQNDYWLFEARVQYGERDSPIRVPLEVKWAGDTPVITVTKVLFPGIGVFTARVVIYGDRYAGTWQGSDHGGHLFGKIVKDDDSAAASE